MEEAQKPLDKLAIARALREIAAFLELKRANPYKVRAYETGAAALESVSEDLGKVIDENRLTRVKGIGESLAAVIAQLYHTGRSELLENLREEMPPGIIELSRVPGLTPRRIQMLHDALEIASLSQLKSCCQRGEVAKVKGFGKKTEQSILDGIHAYETREEKIILLSALELARSLEQHLSTTVTAQVSIAGSVRRWAEIVTTIDMVAATSDGAKPVLDLLKTFPLVVRTEEEEPHSATVRLADGTRVRLTVCQRQQYVPTLVFATGSTAHVEALQKRAETMGMQFIDGKLLRKGKAVLVDDEQEFYHALDLPYMPPEVRESGAEIEEALKDGFDHLLQYEHLKGAVHCHTFYSDGKHSVEDMARAAEELGFEYITITDHSPAAHYADGLSIDELKRQWEDIDKAQEKLKIKILRGTESDILEDGSLDYPDEVLDKFDVIIGSIHSRMKMDEDQMTRRLVNCMRRPHFKVWGHALGRLLLRREPFACRMEEVLDAAAESRVAIEVNGDPYRLDMEPRWIREARKRNIPFVVSADAHSTRGLSALQFGAHMARRGWLRKSEVLNTLPVEQFCEAVRPR